MSEGDTFIYENTLENEVIEKPFISKEVQIVYDSNNGVYNNQILFSTGNLNNTGKWVDYANSYIEIPVVMALKSSADISGGNTNAFMMGLKNGSVQLIDSIILQYNGTSMVQQSIFTNVIQHFKIMSSWTYEDQLKWGPTTQFWPDDTSSMHFTNAAASPYGDGTSNNQVSASIPTSDMAAWTSSITGQNRGFANRLQNAALNIAAGNNGLKVLTTAQANQVGRAYFGNNGAGGATQVYYWQILLTLRLKDMADFFNKIPILKSARIDLTINFNSFSHTVTYVNGTNGPTSGTMVTATFTQLSGHTCPYMLASAANDKDVKAGSVPTQPNAIIGANGTLTVGLGINGVNGVAGLANLPSTIFNNCRWYVPLYEANPEFEQNLLATNPLKTIYYDDFYTYTSITAQTGSFSQLVTSGVKNPKYLVMVPFFNAAAANSGNVGGYAPYQSCFDSAPGTASPVTLTNLQVQVGGKTLFPLIEQYNFQQFMDEFSSIFALNGGKSQAMTSGLITQQWWENAPIYVADLARRLPQDDESPKSIQVSCTVASSKPMGGGTAVVDIIAFVVYQRSVTFNLINGLIESST